MSAGVAEPLRRAPAVAGAFYPANPARLRALVASQLAEAGRRDAGGPGRSSANRAAPVGILVPHAGLEYSGIVAAAAWRLLAEGPANPSGVPLTVVLLGTNHRAGWLDGIGAWDRGTWATSLGDVQVDERLAAAILALGPPFLEDPAAHLDEHSLEVQLPFLQLVAPTARIVPLAVSAGTGPPAIAAGGRLGDLLSAERAGGWRIVVAISTDMAHYPPAREAAWVTAQLQAAIVAGDPQGLAMAERASRTWGVPGLACGMCGIEPAVLGLAALGALGAHDATVLAAATSADAGGRRDRTVGYLAVAFT